MGTWNSLAGKAQDITDAVLFLASGNAQVGV